VLGGAVIASRELIKGMRTDFSTLGGTLDPHAAFLILRGLKTYFVRYQAQCAAAARIAQWLAEQPAVARVHYPGLPGHPQHALAARQMQDFGTIVTFDLKGDAHAGRRCVDALQLFALSASLGSTESLALTPQLMGVRELSAEQQRLSAITPGTIRLSIGLEDVDELIEDLGRGLQAAGG
jgi:cystathionine beta-lyase/cystathionine gamma-synthase